MSRKQVQQAVIFPGDMELERLRKENARMKNVLNIIRKKDYFPDSRFELWELQECITMAESVMEDID